MVELVDTLALGASAARRGGSSPLSRTKLTKELESSPDRTAFSLVLRSKNQRFSWGEWDLASRDATTFLFCMSAEPTRSAPCYNGKWNTNH